MSAPKFTSGPWVAGADGADVCPSAGEKQHVELAHVVGPWSESSWFGSEEAKANAHLIAAAPDLYEALEALANHPGCEDYYCGCGCNDDEVRAARAALARARGETP